MNFLINSPSYYSNQFGIIDEIYYMCKEISRKIDVKNYTDDLDTIGIVPIIAPKEEKKDGAWANYVKISVKSRHATVMLNSDYELYCNATLLEKKKMILDNILQSLHVVKKRLKGQFNLDKMQQDILQISSAFLIE